MAATDITRRDPFSLQPTTPEQAWTVAETLVNSTFVPGAYRGKAADVFAAILYGNEIGLAQMQALNSIHMIDGKASLAAEAMLALVRQAGHQIRFIKSDATTCVVKGRRVEDKDDPDGWQQFSFTIAEAQAAGLTVKKLSRKTGKPVDGNWQLYPADMLRWRAVTRLCKAVFSDAIRGLSGLEEIQDLASEDSNGLVAAQLTQVQGPKRTITASSGDVDAKPKPPARPRRQRTPRGQTPAAVVAVEATVVDAELIEDPPPDPITAAQVKAIQAALHEAGVTERTDRLEFLTSMTGRRITSTKDLTKAEASAVYDHLASPPAVDETASPATEPQRQGLGRLIRELGLGAEEGLAVYAEVTGRTVPSTSDLTFEEANQVHSRLLDMIASAKRKGATDATHNQS